MAESTSRPTAQWAYRTAGQLAESLRERQVSALELIDLLIARIETLDGDLNAVPVRNFAGAREAAREADAALARGERLPLLGVPITIKESYNIAGLPTTWGIPAFKDFVAEEDALAVARLKAAGAVVLGKTNVPLGLGDWQSYNAIHGTTNNPWDRTRSPGGSSGGSAAALAAGFGPLSLGSDIGGSLRVPAHFCGVCAHKPTFDLVAPRGHAPPGAPASARRDLAVIGPMARSVDDLVLALDVIAGPDEAADGRAYRLSLPPARGGKFSDYRVLVVAEHPLLPTSAAVATSLDRLSKGLVAAGGDVRRERPLLPDLGVSAKLYVKLLNAFLSAGMPDDRYQEMRSAAEKIPAEDQSLLAELMRGALMSHRDWLRTDSMRQGLKQQWRALFQDFDVVVCPAAATTAFPHDHTEPQSDRKIAVDGEEFPYLHQLVWADPATTCGLPATVVPVAVA
ncbi:MAG TPA: amidase, partial [Roseiarcus sp.]|nr:amidase [Roseiarcus sp.]